MDQPDRGAEPNFTMPLRQIFLMLVVIALVGLGGFVALPNVLPVFLANLYLNAFILFVFVIGLLTCFWQTYQIFISVGWIKRFAAGDPATSASSAPRLLAPLAALLRERGARMQLGATSARSILDSVATRIDEERDITRYITNLLIFLGLLGTFYGLATTVPAVVETIRSLAPEEGTDGADVFTNLMNGLESQLGGMGTAFSSSLLGLAGSLVVGLLELFASHGQNRFYRELEEWMSSITKVGYAAQDDHGDLPAAAAAPVAGTDAGPALVAISHQVEGLAALVAQGEEGRAALDARIGQLAGAMEKLADRVAQQGAAEASATPLLARIAEGQEQLLTALGGDEPRGAHVDAESRMRLRSIDVQLLRILEEMSAGRQEGISELRTDLAQLTKAVRQLGGQG